MTIKSLFLRYLYLWKWVSRNVCTPPNFMIYSLFCRWRTALSDLYHSRTVCGKNFMQNKMKLLLIFYCAVRVIECLRGRHLCCPALINTFQLFGDDIDNILLIWPAFLMSSLVQITKRIINNSIETLSFVLWCEPRVYLIIYLVTWSPAQNNRAFLIHSNSQKYAHTLFILSTWLIHQVICTGQYLLENVYVQLNVQISSLPRMYTFTYLRYQ